LSLSIDVSWDHFDAAVVASVVDSVLVSSGGDDDLLSLASSALDNELNVIVSGGSIVPSADNCGSSLFAVGVFDSLESVGSSCDGDGGDWRS